MLKKFIALLAALLVSVPAAALAAPSDDAKAKQQEEAARTSADSPKEKSAAKQVTDAAKSALAAAAGIPLPDDGSAQDKNAENMGGEPDAKDPVAVAKHYCTSPRAAAAIVFGWLNDPNYELREERVENPRDVVKEGDEIEVKIIDINTTDRKVALSVKALSSDDEDDYRTYLRNQSGDGSRAKLGDFMKKIR